MKFKKGDMVYYHSKRHGTIPAIVKAVGKSPGKNRDSVFIRGESPTQKGYISAWVHIRNIELQGKGTMRYQLILIGTKVVRKLNAE